LSLPVAVSAQPLVQGKIFTSPEQRQYLDYLRQDFLAKNRQKNFNIEESQIPDIPVATANSTAATTVEYSFDAIMSRADGHLTIWLNHKPLTEQQLPANFRLVREGNTLLLRVKSTDGRSLLLRPGQTIELTGGVVQERAHKAALPAKEQPVTDTKTTAPVAAPGTDATTASKAAETPAKAADKPAAGSTDVKPATAAAAAPNQPTLVDTLPADTLKDPKKLDYMIKSLEALKKGLDENKTQ